MRICFIAMVEVSWVSINDVDFFYPQYPKEDMKIKCDREVQVRKDGQCGYVDNDGNFTLEISKSCYRNEDDAEK